MLLFFLVGSYFLNLSHSGLFWTPVRLMHLQKAAFPPLWFYLEVHELQKCKMLQLPLCSPSSGHWDALVALCSTSSHCQLCLAAPQYSQQSKW